MLKYIKLECLTAKEKAELRRSLAKQKKELQDKMEILSGLPKKKKRSKKGRKAKI